MRSVQYQAAPDRTAQILRESAIVSRAIARHRRKLACRGESRRPMRWRPCILGCPEWSSGLSNRTSALRPRPRAGGAVSRCSFGVMVELSVSPTEKSRNVGRRQAKVAQQLGSLPLCNHQREQILPKQVNAQGRVPAYHPSPRPDSWCEISKVQGFERH